MPTLYVLIFRWFPKRLFSRMMGRLADTRCPGWLLEPLIGFYRWWFRIEMVDFQVPGGGYPTFNAFFTRELRPGARPIDLADGLLLSPVDGTVISLETVRAGRLLQAKGKEYSLAELLGESEGWESFDGGQALTLYLSPRDYHRIHSPCAGEVREFRYIPGELWTVGAMGVRGVPRLFSRNERVVTFLDGPGGRIALVAVGATVVGGIRVVYHPLVTNRAGATAFSERLAQSHPLQAGEELGRFLLGSTVILLTRPGAAVLHPLQPGAVVRMGQTLGRFNKAEDT